MDSWYSASSHIRVRNAHNMARVVNESHSFTCTNAFVYEYTMPAFAFTAEAGPHLPTPDRRYRRLSWPVHH